MESELTEWRTVSNAWVTCLTGDNSWKRLLIPHKRTASHEAV